METILESIFKTSVSHFINREETATVLWQDIEKRYTHSSRHYHNLAHLDHLVNTLLPVRDSIRDWDVLVLAIAYHDIIYNTRKSDNEEESAQHADQVLAPVLPKEKRELLSQFIIATKTHRKSENEDINYFTDADLCILGASWDAYDMYTRQIRKEYRLYPLFIYKPGRRKVIGHFLQMDTIFKTPFFYQNLEKRARENLQRELEALSQ